MTTEIVDAIVIGAGRAGPALGTRCSKEGLRMVLVERGHFGGRCVNGRQRGSTCVNVGSVLTKTLVASAQAIRLARRGAEFGFDADELRGRPAHGSARRTESPTERPSRRR